ncbi:MAG: heme-copper oxidase subunit III [Anaerolineales bacterium]
MTTEHMSVGHDDPFRAGRKLGLDHLKLGFWMFIASEVMFFGGLISTFLKYKLNSPSPQQALLSAPLVGGNTFLLLSSSFTLVMAIAALRDQDRGGMMRYFIFTFLLGSAFLVGQAFEFVTLYSDGVTLTNSLFGSTFFTLTGFHGLHVFIGLVWLSVVIVKGGRGAYSPSSYAGVEIFGLYWHFVDIVWIILFTLIYLI